MGACRPFWQNLGLVLLIMIGATSWVVTKANAESPPARVTAGDSPALTLAASPDLLAQPPVYLPPQSLSIMLAEISREIADQVFSRLHAAGKDNFNYRIAVTVAVPLADFKRDSEFGRVLAEYLLTELAGRGLKVTELRLGRDLHILPQLGEFILSRNPGELVNPVPELDYVVVSTFANTRNTLILHGRLIDLNDGLIKTGWRHTLPLSRELIGLFQKVETPKIPVRGAR